MAYPRPIEFESAERLYGQAIFFWEQYERVRVEYEKWRKIAGQLAMRVRADGHEPLHAVPGACATCDALKAYEEMTKA